MVKFRDKLSPRDTIINDFSDWDTIDGVTL